MFERFYIEISNICNLQCTFCPEVERPKKILSADDFKKIAEQAKPLTRQVCLHLMGEPLAHPDFKRIVKICEDLELRIFLTTNGTLLSRYHEELLNWRSLDQINFSVHSYFANPKKISLAEYLKPIFKFCNDSIKYKKTFYINLRLWNLHETDLQIDNNLQVLDTVKENFNIILNENINVKLNKSKRIAERIYLHFDTEFTWPSLKEKDLGESGTCYGLRKQAAVHANGDVVPCCLDKESVLKLGNIFEEMSDLTQILNSDRAKRIKSGFERGELVEELCKKCRYIDRFK